jgi:uncharacterized protein YoxC
MMMNLACAVALLCLTAPASAGFLDTQRERIVSMPMHSYSKDCGAESTIRVIKSAVSMLQADNVPGAGIDKIYDKSKYQPFQRVLKDGYLMTDCVKDHMYYFADKYGDNADQYKPGSKVSIVHYNAFVAKADRVEMTPTACFEFCRTVPNMGFFGLTNGRSCYCTPYFTPMEDDDSQCDSTCEGDATQTCGGKSRSTIFAMHMCGSTADDLGDSAEKAFNLATDMHDKVETAKGFVEEMENIADGIMPLFSKVGDSAASNLAQTAKEMSSGVLLHMAEETDKLKVELDAQAGEARKLAKDPNLEDSSVMAQAERLMEDIDEKVAEAEAATDKLDEMMEYVSPPKALFKSKSALRSYYPVMYFIDKRYDGMDDPKTKGVPAAPTTCTGDLVGLPVVGKDAEACARACDDNLVKGCIGFQHFDRGAGNGQMCFLFSSFKTGFFYTDCAKETQKDTGCYAKFSKFAGGKFEGSGTLQPGGLVGKGFCKECFKKFTKAERCYAA